MIAIAPADVQACIATLASRLGPKGIYTTRADCLGYETGARYGSGQAAFVVRPASTQDVAFVVKTCNLHGVHLIPQGANTGLVGGSTPDGSGTQGVISLERLSSPIELNRLNRSVKVTAGTRLSSLNAALAEAGLWFPVDLGADPTIGGMVATNTGGTRFIRYGDVRKNVLGIEVVLWNGEVLKMMEDVRKNNTGLDAKQLFIGTAGKLGIVTQAVLEVHPLPNNTAAALVTPSGPGQILPLLEAMEAQFASQLTSFEGMSSTALKCAFDYVPTLRNPFGDDLPDYAILIELSEWGRGSCDQSLQERLEVALGDALERDLISNAFVHDAANLWSIRHHISDSLKSRGRVIALDVSIPRDRFVELRDRACNAVRNIAGKVLVADFGHVGDGGTHFNMIWPAEVPYKAEVAESLRVAVYDIVSDLGGSFSAEHGIGPFNHHFYERYVSEPRRDLEARIVAATVGIRHDG